MTMAKEVEAPTPVSDFSELAAKVERLEESNAELRTKMEFQERLIIAQKEAHEKLQKATQIKRGSMSIVGEDEDEETEVDPRSVPPTDTFEIEGQQYKFLNAKLFYNGAWHATYDILQADDEDDLRHIVETYPNAVKKIK
jgi:hypothetical protein